MTGEDERRKQDIIGGLLCARACILDAVASLQPEKCDSAFLGIWSVVDLLAHLEGWGHTNVAAGE